jgi:hypothetical protein
MFFVTSQGDLVSADNLTKLSVFRNTLVLNHNDGTNTTYTYSTPELAQQDLQNIMNQLTGAFSLSQIIPSIFTVETSQINVFGAGFNTFFSQYPSAVLYIEDADGGEDSNSAYMTLTKISDTQCVGVFGSLGDGGLNPANGGALVYIASAVNSTTPISNYLTGAVALDGSGNHVITMNNT